MKGFETDPVQEIRRILRDSYSADSVLKELIQNADDARANTLHLGWTTDWPAELHPLLTGPVVFLLNDGKFEEKDAEAILRLDIGAKGGDIAAIGKYGLGMKSLFHHCEGFFYLTSEDQPVPESARDELVTPWAGRANRAFWRDDAPAKREILQRIQAWPHGCSSWFCVAIPLRLPEHEVDGQALMPGTYPEVGDVLAEMTAIEIAEILPLLRHVRSVSIWEWRDGALQLQTTIVLDGSANRLAFPTIQPGCHRSVEGVVLVDELSGVRSRTDVQFAGCETLLNECDFSDLKERDDWPQNVSLADDGQNPQDRPEKAEPHCAVLFARTTPKEPRLEIRSVVFLPVAKPTWELKPSGASEGLQILLHGYFFLDAGRQEVLLGSPGEGGVEMEWNRRLFETGVLPLIPRALHEFTVSARLTAEAIEHLTETLQSSRFFADYSVHVCRDRQWVYQICPHERQLRAAWCLVEASPVLGVPAPPEDDLEFLSRVLPGLIDVCQRSVVTFAERPRLCRSSVLTSWNSSGHQEALLRSVPDECLGEEPALSYLAAVLEAQGQLDPAAQSCLLVKVKRFVATEGRRLLANCASTFQRFVGALDPQTWVCLGPVDRATERVVCEMNGLGFEHLVLPASLAPDVCTVKWDTTEAKDALRWLSEAHAERNAVSVSSIALRVIEAAAGTREEQLQVLGTYPVIAVRSAREGGSSILMSWRRLIDDLGGHRLYATRSELLPSLQNSLHDESIHALVDPSGIRPFAILFGLESPPTCSRRACLDKLNEAPVLAGPDRRRDLLARLLPSEPPSAELREKRALRYLLHANRRAIDDQDTLLVAWTSINRGSEVSRLVAGALRVLEEDWRFVHSDLCERLNPKQRSWLGVKDIGNEVLSQILERIDMGGLGFDWVSEIGLTPEEAEVVLLEFTDERFWRVLPLHRCTTSGGGGSTFISLTELPCYLAPDDPEDALGAMSIHIKIVLRPQDPLLLQRYHANGIEEWSRITQLRELLKQDDPSAHAGDILTVLGAIGLTRKSIPPDLLIQLRETRWLPMARGTLSPSDVIDLPHMEGLLSGQLGAPWQDGVFFTVHDFPLLTSEINSDGLGLLRSRQILPPFPRALELLGESLGRQPEWRVGRVRQILDDPSRVSDVVKALHDCTDLPPGYAFLVEIYDRMPDKSDEIQESLLPGLLRDVPLEIAIRILTALSDAAQRSLTNASDVFRWYVVFLTEHPDFDTAHLSSLSFPNRRGHWVSSKKLCFEAEGIDDVAVLDPEIARAFPRQFGQQPQHRQPEAVEENPTSAGEVSELVAYFAPWRELIRWQVVGGFLSFFGDDDRLMTEAERALNPYSVFGVRAKVHWPVRQDSIMTGVAEDIHEAMRKQRFHIHIAQDGSTVNVRNLMGYVFPAPVGRPVTSIFVGDLFGRSPGDNVEGQLRYKTLTVRAFDPTTMSANELQSLLLVSAELLFEKVYHRFDCRLRGIWDDLAQPDQLTLEIAQDTLLEHAW